MSVDITGKKIIGVKYGFNEENDDPKKDKPSSCTLTLEDGMIIKFYATRDEWEDDRLGIIVKKQKY